MKQTLFALLAISLAAGCTTTRTMNSFSADNAERIEPGETVVIEYVDGATEKVEIHHYGVSSLDVVTADDTIQSIDYTDIRAIHDKDFSVGKTAAAGTGVLVLAVLIGLSSMAFMPSGP